MHVSLLPVRASASLVLLLVASTACQNRAPAPKPTQATPSTPGSTASTHLKNIYAADPSSLLSIMGNFSTGAALVDLDQDGWTDLVLANGNDVAPQGLVAFYNRKSPQQPFPGGATPDWYSAGYDYHGGLAVGDVDGDGLLDVAVAVPFDKLRKGGSGRVDVFFNRGGKLEPAPSYHTDSGFMPTGCAFADVDGDGDLDLAVSVLSELSPDGLAIPGGFQRVYLNDGHALGNTPAWKSEARLRATSVLGADIDQDGRMDLAFAAPSMAIFYGQPRAATGVPLHGKPDWTSASFNTPQSAFYGLDVGRVGSDSTLALVGGLNCENASPCTNGFFLYQPAQGNQPVWSHAASNSSKVLLADVNADGLLDLLTSQMGIQFSGAPVAFFQGTATSFENAPGYQGSLNVIGQQLAVGDLRNRAPCSRTASFQSDTPRSVVTLRERQVFSVTSVKRDGVPVTRFAWAPGGNWISLDVPLGPGERLEVEYTTSQVIDVFTAVSTPNLSSFFLYSWYTPAPGSCGNP
ncbi:FG-GAP and VCBS repeat-containing protein [Archangium sp.]|uniref:FG-GAP and VCBS repeat-containing protein n=1 Tax=Archangium sp. TaxID=1872627 RepID=UPI0038998A08